MDTIIKLNARGTIIYVDEAILIKSNYFRHMLRGEGFQKSLPNDEGAYYVDCDHDVMTELIAYMETGHFKYKKINLRFLKIMLDKYGVDIEKPKTDNIDKINTLLDKVIEYIANNLINKYEEISVRFMESNTNEIQMITLKNKERIFRKGDIITIGCKYNSKLYPINAELLRSNKTIIYSALEKYKVDKILFVNRISKYNDIEIEFCILPQHDIKNVDEHVDENINESDSENDENDSNDE